LVAAVVSAVVAASSWSALSAWSASTGTTPFDRLLGGHHGAAVTEADGVLPDSVTVFDGGYAGVAHLDPGLLRALRKAATDADDEGVELFVNSGWRSPEYQDRLLRDAVSTYGSEQEAARWVATAETSPHVSGEAVDIGPAAARAWLSGRGAAYGLCEVYGNEPWHYELRPQAVDHGCPTVYPDPTRDPRMRSGQTPRSRPGG